MGNNRVRGTAPVIVIFFLGALASQAQAEAQAERILVFAAASLKLPLAESARAHEKRAGHDIDIAIHMITISSANTLKRKYHVCSQCLSRCRTVGITEETRMKRHRPHRDEAREEIDRRRRSIFYLASSVRRCRSHLSKTCLRGGECQYSQCLQCLVVNLQSVSRLNPSREGPRKRSTSIRSHSVTHSPPNPTQFEVLSVIITLKSYDRD